MVTNREKPVLVRAAARSALRNGLISKERYAEILADLERQERRDKEKARRLAEAGKSRMLRTGS